MSASPDVSPTGAAPLDETLMDAYVTGTLPPAEAQQLTDRLAQDPEARAQVAEHEAAVRTIRTAGRLAVRARLRRLEEELTQRQAPTGTRGGVGGTAAVPQLTVSWRRRWVSALATAAVVVVAASLGVFWRLQPGLFLDRPALVERYALPEPGLPVLMSESEEPADGAARRKPFSQAMNAYRLGRYPEALAAWERLPVDQVSPDTLNYYRGIFLLRMRRARAASEALATVQRQAGSALRARAEYYLALAQWADNRPDEARRAFARLAAQPTHPFAHAAHDLLPLVR